MCGCVCCWFFFVRFNWNIKIWMCGRKNKWEQEKQTDIQKQWMRVREREETENEIERNENGQREAEAKHEVAFRFNLICSFRNTADHLKNHRFHRNDFVLCVVFFFVRRMIFIGTLQILPPRTFIQSKFGLVLFSNFFFKKSLSRTRHRCQSQRKGNI